MTLISRVLRAASRRVDTARRSHHLSPRDRWAVPLTQRNLERLLRFRTMLALVRDKPGAVVECGLGVLKSFQMLALLLQEEGQQRPLWGFDSFMGYPEPSDMDFSPGFKKSGPAKMTPDEARAVMDGLQLDIPVRIIPGWFEDTLPRVRLPPVALLHLDVVLHDSYRTCLEHLYARVVPGGVVLFDEYPDETCELYVGAGRAIDVFLAEHGLTIQKEPASGRYYVRKPE